MSEQVHNVSGGAAFFVPYRFTYRSDTFGSEKMKGAGTTAYEPSHPLFMAHNVCGAPLVYGLSGIDSVWGSWLDASRV